MTRRTERCKWIVGGLGFGDNKLRKFDYVLHEALSSGADTIVSGSVVQSNSQRQVAAVAAKLRLACHLAVYHGRLEAPTPEHKTSGNALEDVIFLHTGGAPALFAYQSALGI